MITREVVISLIDSVMNEDDYSEEQIATLGRIRAKIIEIMDRGCPPHAALIALQQATIEHLEEQEHANDDEG